MCLYITMIIKKAFTQVWRVRGSKEEDHLPGLNEVISHLWITTISCLWTHDLQIKWSYNLSKQGHFGEWKVDQLTISFASATSVSISQMARVVKNPLASAVRHKRGVQSLGREDSLEKGMATHSNILAWTIPQTEEPGRPHSTGSQRVKHN